MYKPAITAEYEGLTESGRERVRCCGGKGCLAGVSAKSQAVVEIMENCEGSWKPSPPTSPVGADSAGK